MRGEWSENVHQYPVEIERMMLTRVDAVDMWIGRWFGIWYVSSLGSCDTKLIFSA